MGVGVARMIWDGRGPVGAGASSGVGDVDVAFMALSHALLTCI